MKLEMNNIIKELKERWFAESPQLFQKITNVCTTLGSAAFGVLAMNTVLTLTQYGIDPIVFTICGYILVGAGAMGLTSKITKQDGK